jgi:hypothetical protein
MPSNYATISVDKKVQERFQLAIFTLQSDLGHKVTYGGMLTALLDLYDKTRAEGELDIRPSLREKLTDENS